MAAVVSPLGVGRLLPEKRDFTRVELGWIVPKMVVVPSGLILFDFKVIEFMDLEIIDFDSISTSYPLEIHPPVSHVLLVMS